MIRSGCPVRQTALAFHYVNFSAGRPSAAHAEHPERGPHALGDRQAHARFHASVHECLLPRTLNLAGGNFPGVCCLEDQAAVLDEHVRSCLVVSGGVMFLFGIRRIVRLLHRPVCLVERGTVEFVGPEKLPAAGNSVCQDDSHQERCGAQRFSFQRCPTEHFNRLFYSPDELLNA